MAADSRLRPAADGGFWGVEPVSCAPEIRSTFRLLTFAGGWSLCFVALGGSYHVRDSCEVSLVSHCESCRLR